MGAISDGSYLRFNYGTGPGQVDRALQNFFIPNAKHNFVAGILRSLPSIFMGIGGSNLFSGNNNFFSGSSDYIQDDDTIVETQTVSAKKVNRTREKLEKALNNNNLGDAEKHLNKLKEFSSINSTYGSVYTAMLNKYNKIKESKI